MLLKALQIRKAIFFAALAATLLTACTQSMSPTLPTTPPESQVESRTRASALQDRSLVGIGDENAATTYPAMVLQSSPSAFFQLNDSSSKLANSVAGGISGVYGSGVSHLLPALTQGSNGSAGFPGGSAYNANGFASTTAASVLQPARPTIEAWFKLTASSAANTYVPLVIYGNQGTTYGLYLQGQGTFDTLFYQQTNAGMGRLLLHGLTDLKPGTTYHVVTAFDGSKVTTYVNGIVDQSAAYAGSVGYAKSSPIGLQLGGQLASTRPPFPGSISEVALYGAPLSSQIVLNHFLVGQLAQIVSELAVPSDSFVDSIGVNTHFPNSSSVYGTSLSQVESLLVASGIRHFRDNISFNTTICNAMKHLAASNVHGTYVALQSYTESQIIGFPALVSPSLEQFEAPNEEDDQGQSAWEQPAIAFQKTFYSWIKGNPATSKYPVLGPAMAWIPDYQKLGNLSAYLDDGNFHDYMGAYNPGYPGGPYGGIKAMLAGEKATSGTKPVMSTELGYGTTLDRSEGLVDNATDLRYVTRQYFEQFNAGVVRSYIYEFLDEANTTTAFTTYGLITNALVPKPSYTAIKSLIEAIEDPGAAFKPASLSYSLSGTSNVHHLLMQKRNGTFVLALWQEVPGWNVSGGGDIAVTSLPVTVTTATHFASATLSTMAESGSLSTANVPWTGTQTTIQLTDKVSLLDLIP